MTDLFTHQFADNIRMARSKAMIKPAAATYNLIRIPRFAFVSDVVFYVKTAGSTATIQVGMIGNGAAADPDFFLNATDAAANAAGYKRAKYDYGTSDFVTHSGVWFQTASGVITATVGTTQTSGEFIVFATYMVIH